MPPLLTIDRPSAGLFATAYAKTLLDDVDAPTARATLGLGTAALSAVGDFEPAGAIAAALVSYLPLAGGTMTGNLLFGGTTRVGIGTTSPNVALTLSDGGTSGIDGANVHRNNTLSTGSSTYPGAFFERTGNTSGKRVFAYRLIGDNGFELSSINDSSSANVTRAIMLWSSDGKVAINRGGSAPLATLDVSGTGLFTGSVTTAYGGAGLAVFGTQGGRGMNLGNGTLYQNLNYASCWEFFEGIVIRDSGTLRLTANAGYPKTVSSPIISAEQTWNNGAVDFVGILADFTSTASGAGSLLMDLRVDGVSRFSVNKGGLLTTTYVSAGGYVYATGSLRVGGRGGLYPGGSDGVLVLLNAVETDFSRLCFGGTTSSFPALKRSSAALACRLADDSGYADFECAGLKFGTHSALAAETVSGYITITDAAGNSRKLAVVS